jgi:type IV pilus assembly protein PilQ
MKRIKPTFTLFLLLCCVQALSATAPNPVTTKNFSPNEPLTFNFREIQVRDMLQLLAKIAAINMVIDDTVQGSMAVYLQHVSWQQTLNTLLITKNLSAKREGNVMFIAPTSQLTTQIQQQLQQQDLMTSLIALHYANAATLATLLRSPESGLLSPRGHTQADARTNSLWVSDVPQYMRQIRYFIKCVDVPAKQVLIKTRIVSVDDSFVKELGLQFGTLPNSPTKDRHHNDGLGIDLPRRFNAGHFDVAFARVGINSLLDLQINALENEGHARMISSPELLTADHVAASIEAGDEIPYQEKTSSGATNVTFKKAVLSLKVTPQLTAQNRIVLDLEVNQDRVGSLLINGVPSIQTRSVQTQVLVKDGETLVLGGIYEQSHRQNSIRIPVLGTLPLIGNLFSDKRNTTQRTELLVFVTPKMMQQTISFKQPKGERL